MPETQNPKSASSEDTKRQKSSSEDAKKKCVFRKRKTPKVRLLKTQKAKNDRKKGARPRGCAIVWRQWSAVCHLPTCYTKSERSGITTASGKQLAKQLLECKTLIYNRYPVVWKLLCCCCSAEMEAIISLRNMSKPKTFYIHCINHYYSNW